MTKFQASDLVGHSMWFKDFYASLVNNVEVRGIKYGIPNFSKTLEDKIYIKQICMYAYIYTYFCILTFLCHKQGTL